jgi:hypothetical protein
MQRVLPAAILACTAVLAASAHAVAIAIMAMPTPDRVATAEIVIVGKVTAIEDKTVMAPRFPGDANKAEYKIALVQITDALKAPKGLTTVRLGYVPTPVVVPGPGPIRRPINRFPQFTPTVGQEVCLLLTKHADADFHIVNTNFDAIDKKAVNFDKEVALIKRCLKLLDDPNASLKAKDAQDRLLTAAMLLAKYGRPTIVIAGQNPKTEPIAAEQSKLILEALASADWSKRDEVTQLSPQMLLGRLNLTAKDGWTPPAFKDYQKEFPAYAQRWLKDHAETYRIQRFVPAKNN